MALTFSASCKAASAFLILLTFAAAQSADSCWLNEFTDLNATVSATVTAFDGSFIAQDVQDANYTISTGVRQTINTSGKHPQPVTEQVFWIQSNPVVKEPQSLPFRGCAFVMAPNKGSKLIANGLESNYGCPTDMGPNGIGDCQGDAIVEMQGKATTIDLNSPHACDYLADAAVNPSARCADYGYYVRSVTPFNSIGNQSIISDMGCHETSYNIFNGSSTSNVLEIFNQQPIIEENVKTDWYDQALKTSIPVMLVAWPNNRTQGWRLDTRAACLLPGEGVVAGSKSVKGSASRGVPAPGEGVEWLLPLALVAALMMF